MRNTQTLRKAAMFLGCLLVGGCTDGLNVFVASNTDENSVSATGHSDSPSENGNEDGQHDFTNRLARETSPYLLLHAHNPVDWYPWGPEAFATAKRKDKPIFLSIGYSSCFWCHVMERKVFSDPEIARFMNANFVNVKVDREERPDVDDIYMTALSVYFRLSGSSQGGGWPLSMFLTPEGKPIAGGTYFPPEDEGGRVGFPTVMRKIVDIWQNRRDEVEQNAEILTEQVRRSLKPTLSLKPTEIDRSLVDVVTDAVKASYDPQHGGVDFEPSRPDAPKFPVPVKLELLAYEIRNRQDREAQDVLETTLDHIAAGGIRDHLGGGFHRYSTDRQWRVPHFEKMLYDNAQLARVYAQAYARTGELLYREAAVETCEFVLREMTDPNGGFYSALDAETDGVEGKYYVWTKVEVESVLGSQDADLFIRVYGLDRPAVFEAGHVLHLPQPIADVAQELGITRRQLQQRLAPMRQELLTVRKRRERPLRDDKILTSWNGLMIRALADCGRLLHRDEYIHAAERAALFVLSEMRDDQGRLLRSYRAQTAKLNAYLDDYAFLVQGLLALYQATGEQKWLNASRRLTELQIELFWDESGDGFFFTSDHHEELLARTKNAYDAVLPSGNSISVRNLLRLKAYSGQNQTYRNRAAQTLEVFAAQFKETPRGMTQMALALAEYLDEPDFRGISNAAISPSPRGPTDGSAQDTRPFDRDGPVPSDPSHDQRSVTPDSVNDNTRNDTDGQPTPPREPPGPQAEDDGDAGPSSRKQPQKVTARAYLSVDRLPVGGECRVVMFVDIEKGWHINANPAEPAYLVPTTFTIKTRHGTVLRDVRYPEGHKLEVEDFESPLSVYDGRVAIYGVLQVPETVDANAEQFELTVKYQACNDRTCLAPQSVTLSGQVPFAQLGESVQAVNEELFPDGQK